MVARVARVEGIDVEAAQRTMGEADAIIRPLVEGLTGYRGQLDLATADGKYMAVTLSHSAEEARAAESTFDEEMPRRLGDLFNQWGGRRVSVEVYQVVADERR